ncbi:ATP-binding protein [Glycomyces sp. A-F 0318]|uniref:AlbA family DNA-binding domain-containing protein n=1 Tax=Glycomyces amatae TaxID=2881355 RepID=UPI001E49CA8B|nr:ATP-binding protein [Glycomyces amatae]MCD0445903.1 ATP-binding protein [Glycomyces amatae]
MDDYTALHRHLGRPRGPVDDGLLDAAVEAKLRETDDLDWKQRLPPMKGLAKTEFPKNVTAFANAGGGTIVYGVNEDNMAAKDRFDVGDCTEADIRTIRSVAASNIHPPILGLRVYCLDQSAKRAVMVVVPPSLDRPHMILCDHQRFGAPLRNGADTVWMSEREIAERYRQRFAEQRSAVEALDQLYDGARSGAGIGYRAWAFAIARPRLPIAAPAGLSSEQVQAMINAAKVASATMMHRSRWQPLHAVDSTRLRPGLRRWTARSRKAKLEGQASIHQDGAVTLSADLGEEATADGETVRYVDSWRLESLVANIVTLTAQTGAHVGSTEYEIRVGLHWHDNHQLKVVSIDEYFDSIDFQDAPILDRYDPVDATLALDTGPEDLLQQARTIATDCINQGAVEDLVVLRKSL